MAGTLKGSKVPLMPSAGANQVLQALAASVMPVTADPMGAMQSEQHMRNGSDVASGLMLDVASTQAFAQSIDAWLAIGGLAPYQPPFALPPRQEAQLNRRMSALVAQNKPMLAFANAPTNPDVNGVPAEAVTREPSRDRIHAQARTDLAEWLAGMGDRQLAKSEDLTPPKAVQAACQRGLDLAPDHGGDGLTSGAISRARSMAAGNAVSSETIGRMASFFARHSSYEKTANPPSAGYVAWQLWGGDAGKAWAESKSDTQKAGELVEGKGVWQAAKDKAKGKANPEAYAAAIARKMTKKALTGDDVSFFEKAAGDRGGHVIGTTASGKPIYASTSAQHGSYKGLSAGDHKEAAQMHRAAAEDHTKRAKAATGKDFDTVSHHAGMAGRHELKAKEHEMVARRGGVTKSQSFFKGPGDRGGHVIGTTASGKPIYASSHSSNHAAVSAHHEGEETHHLAAQAHPSYTSADHLDAAEHHERAAAQATTAKDRSGAHAMAQAHSMASMSVKKSASHGFANDILRRHLAKRA